MHCSGYMDVAWALFWEIVAARNFVLFRVKWLRPAMKGTSGARRLRTVRFGANRFLLCVLQ